MRFLKKFVQIDVHYEVYIRRFLCLFHQLWASMGCTQLPECRYERFVELIYKVSEKIRWLTATQLVTMIFILTLCSTFSTSNSYICWRCMSSHRVNVARVRNFYLLIPQMSSNFEAPCLLTRIIAGMWLLIYIQWFARVIPNCIDYDTTSLKCNQTKNCNFIGSRR